MDVWHTETFTYIHVRRIKVCGGCGEARSHLQDKANTCRCFDCSNNIVWEDTDVIKMHLIKRGFVDGYTIWSHHGEAGGTFNNTDIDTGSDEVGGDDANENDHVMMDDDYDRGDQNGDETDARVEP